MRIALAQMQSVVGAFEQNVLTIKQCYQKACAQGARILVTPELSLSGYLLYELLNRSEIFERSEKAFQDLVSFTRHQKTALVLGHFTKNEGSGRFAYNCASVLEEGACVFTQAKTLLPDYDVFSEQRYFEPAEEQRLWFCDGIGVALGICEDFWWSSGNLSRIYARDPVQSYVDQKASLVLALACSPYEGKKVSVRHSLHAQVAQRVGAPLIYVNQVGATDEILFDGNSFSMGASGNLLHQLSSFRSELGFVEVLPEVIQHSVAEESKEVLVRGLVFGIREYFRSAGFKKAILGLSGGIDSAVVGMLAVEALGASQVLGVMMPGPYSSPDSLEDARVLAEGLGMPYEVHPISDFFEKMQYGLKRESWLPLTLENLQARIRGLMLMTLSNQESALVLTTGNKSEIAMGYCTLYGDTVGALAPIGDLFKTRVYELGWHLHRTRGFLPERSLTRAPSAELRPNQRDDQSLPPYGQLDPLLEDYLEKGWSAEKLVEKYAMEPNFLRTLLRQIESNEYKRRQFAPSLKVTSAAFGAGRKIPIAKVWN